MNTNNFLQQAIATLFGIKADKPEILPWEGRSGRIRLGDIAKNFTKATKRMSFTDITKALLDLPSNKKKANWAAIDAAVGRDFKEVYKNSFQKTKEEEFASIIISLILEADKQGVDLERSIELYHQYLQNSDLFTKAAKTASEHDKQMHKQNKNITVDHNVTEIKRTTLRDDMHWPEGLPR